MILYLAAHAALILFNLANVWIDAYRIMRHKRIAHGINLGAYTLFVAFLSWVTHWNAGVITLFCVSAFCNRQGTFDIPLNLRRGLKWDHVSLAKPPKAFLDRIEIRVFGYNGRAPVFVYGVVWVVCLIVKIFV